MKALITGASSGIGKSIAIYLSELGYEIIAVGKDKNRLDKLKEEYGSQNLIYEDDIRNIDNILNPILNLDERMNAQRRFVNFNFIVNDPEKYYGYDSERLSDTRALIHFLSDKYCSKIPFRSSQFDFNVYLTERNLNMRKSPSDININIIHLIK